MSALKEIAERAAERKLPFLVIGGLAVIFHGYQGTTFDLDLMISREQRNEWIQLLANQGYVIFKEGETFLQLNPPINGSTPIDLMLTNAQTFAKLLADGVAMLEKGVSVTAVSLASLIALKCHAIKHGHAGRIEKDVDDVIYLVLAKRLNMDDSSWRELILKYGTPELYKKLKKSARAKVPDLDLPDWSGMDQTRYTQRISTESALQLNEEFRKQYFSAPRFLKEWQQRKKCDVEFVF